MRCPSPLTLTSVIAVTALSLLAAGCGGGGSSTTAATTTQNGALAFTHCMRSHGVANFPDPNSSGDIPKDKVVPLAGSPQFQVAQRACPHLFSGPQETAQQRRAQLADALAFARCVRVRGFQAPGPDRRGRADPADGDRGGHRPASAEIAEGRPDLRACDPRPAHPGGDRAGGKWRLSRRPADRRARGPRPEQPALSPDGHLRAARIPAGRGCRSPVSPGRRSRRESGRASAAWRD